MVNGERGFTVVEMIVVVTIIAVLAVVGSSSYRTWLSKGSVTSEINDLANMMQYARAESLRQGVPVTICSGNSTGCSGSTSWDAGYVIFTDYNGNGTLDTGDVLLRKMGASSAGATLAPDATSAQTKFIFNRLGFVSNITATVVTMIGHARTSSSASTKCLQVSVTGQMLTESAGQGGCS